MVQQYQKEILYFLVFCCFSFFFVFILFLFCMTLPIMPSHLPIRCGWVSGVVPRILIAFVNGCGVVLDFLVLLFLPHLSLVSLAYTHCSIVFEFEFEAAHVIFTDSGFLGCYIYIFFFDGLVC